MRFSLRYKILGVLGFLLVLAVGFYTFLASSIFREEKVTLLFDLNHSVAVNTAARLQSDLKQASDEIRLYVISKLSTGRFRIASTRLSESLSGIRVFESRDGEFLPTSLGDSPGIQRNVASATPRLKEALDDGSAFFREGNDFFIASKIETLIQVGTRSTPRTYVAMAKYSSQKVLDTVQSSALFETFLVDGQGNEILHCNADEVFTDQRSEPHPLVGKAKRSTQSLSGVDSFRLDGQDWYGAFAPLGVGDLMFLSQANESEVNRAIDVLLKRSALFGMIVITLTFLASIVFSSRLTQSLSVLTASAHRIGKGELSSKIELKSRDEVGDLANTFNEMADALRVSREKIEKYNEELESMVDLRTKQLKEKNVALADIQQKLIKTTQLAAAGEVAGRTAHEVLNPLTAALTRLEQLKIKSLSETQKILPKQLLEILEAWETEFKKGGFDQLATSLKVPSSVEQNMTLFEEDVQNLRALATEWERQQGQFGVDLGFIEQQGQRIQRIVDGMRELIRSSSNRALTSVHKAVNEAILTMSDAAERQNIALTNNFEATQDEVFANSDELVQILTNLLRNAFQAVAGQSGEKSIQVLTLNQEDLLEIEIRDNGVGISAESQAKIFDPGFTTKGPNEGTGLGLAICRRYARAFGGDVVLKWSDAEKGTCFSLQLPLDAQEKA